MPMLYVAQLLLLPAEDVTNVLELVVGGTDDVVLVVTTDEVVEVAFVVVDVSVKATIPAARTMIITTAMITMIEVFMFDTAKC